MVLDRVYSLLIVEDARIARTIVFAHKYANGFANEFADESADESAHESAANKLVNTPTGCSNKYYTPVDTVPHGG
jgi:wobble nucleotide-excising tRNase